MSLKSIVKGIGNFVGGPIGTLATNVAGALFSSSSSAKQARTEMQFQERMSSTAHQREVADLRAAGLNPILSANAGASSPSGAMGQVPDLSDAGNDVLAASQSAKRLSSDLKTAEEMRKDIQAGVRLKDAQARALGVKGVLSDAANSGVSVLRKIIDSEALDPSVQPYGDRNRLQHLKETEKRARARQAASARQVKRGNDRGYPGGRVPRSLGIPSPRRRP